MASHNLPFGRGNFPFVCEKLRRWCMIWAKRSIIHDHLVWDIHVLTQLPVDKIAANYKRHVVNENRLVSYVFHLSLCFGFLRNDDPI